MFLAVETTHSSTLDQAALPLLTEAGRGGRRKMSGEGREESEGEEEIKDSLLVLLPIQTCIVTAQ